TIDRDSQKHLRVLGSAILRALAEKNAGAVRVHPHAVGVIRNQVGFASELRNPEAVVRVSRKQTQECRSGMTRVTYRDVQLVRGNDAQFRIAKLPPVLVADRGDFHPGPWLRTTFNSLKSPV